MRLIPGHDRSPLSSASSAWRFSETSRARIRYSSRSIASMASLAQRRAWASGSLVAALANVAGTRVDSVAEDVPDGVSAEDHAAGLASSPTNLAACVEQ